MLLAPSLQTAIREAAEQFDLPETLLVAWSWEATAGTVASYRYDVNLDRQDVAGKPGTWSSHPDWIAEGPTCEEYFLFHPEREADCLPEANYDFVAQTTIAVGYGPFLLRYPVALRHGFTGDPEALRSLDDGVAWAARVLRAGIEESEALGSRGKVAVCSGLMRVGGRVPSRSKVAAVEEAHKTLFGHGYFE